MIKFKELKESGGAGDWGTDQARKKLQKDTPGQGITDIGVKNKERKESVEFVESEHKVIKVVGDDIKNMKKNRVYGTFPATDKGRDQATMFQLKLKRQKGVEANLVWESLNEVTDFRSGDTVYQVGSKLRGKVLHKGNRDQIFVKFGSITKSIPASELRLAESVELEETRKYKVVKGDKERMINKQELRTYMQMGWKQVKEDIDLQERPFAGDSVLKDLMPGVYNFLDRTVNNKRYKFAVRTFLDLRKKNPKDARNNLIKAAKIADVDVRVLDRLFRNMVNKGIMPKHLMNYYPTFVEGKSFKDIKEEIFKDEEF